jgi:hypothetical protein
VHLRDALQDLVDLPRSTSDFWWGIFEMRWARLEVGRGIVDVQ